LSISSEGYGHSSRALAIASRLDASELLIGSYAYALERIRKVGHASVEVPQEVRFVGGEGSFDVGKTILHNPGSALALNTIIQREIQIIQDHGITLVVADGRIAPVLAAARLDVPCLVLTNQSAFYPFFERNSPLVQLFGRSFEWVMKFWLSSAEEILIPDFPPPDTVCLPNLSDKYQVKKRTRFVGPLVAWKAEDVPPLAQPHPQQLAGKPYVVVSLGGHQYRRPLFDAVMALAQVRQDVAFDVLSSFSVPHPPKNVRLLSVVANSAPYFKAADVVLTQAGHSTAMELLTLGKPALIVPDSNQIEQENNAHRMSVLGVAVTLSYADLDSGSQALSAGLDRLLGSPTYYERASAKARIAHALDGVGTAAGVLREYAQRLIRY
jgi:uncharacterized protein (TIGR00661 family)